MTINETPPPTYLNRGEYWWCNDSGHGIIPVLISAIRKQNGDYHVWYDCAGTDEGFNINDVKWYGKIDIPKIAIQ